MVRELMDGKATLTMGGRAVPLVDVCFGRESGDAMLSVDGIERPVHVAVGTPLIVDTLKREAKTISNYSCPPSYTNVYVKFLDSKEN